MLIECDLLLKLKKVRQVNSDATLEKIQSYCSDWWEISHQFFNLHQLYIGDESIETSDVSSLIWRSQVLLVACIGLVAITTLLQNTKV